MLKLKLFSAIALALISAGCAHHAKETCDMDCCKDDAKSVTLFNGKDLTGWHNFHAAPGTKPVNWEAKDGRLINTTHGPDLITDASYDNFVLELDFKMPPHGNSGIMYRCDESSGAAWHVGPEYQLWDNMQTPGTGLHDCAAVYDLYPPSSNAAKPAGQWNHAKLVVDHNHVEHWLNGTKVAQYDFNSPDWQSHVANSKFKTRPKFGTLPKGQIALQGDHSPLIEFKNIRLTPLPSK
jgi:hypothetical protein